MLAENDVEERSACEVEVLNGGDFASKKRKLWRCKEGVKKRVTFCQKFLLLLLQCIVLKRYDLLYNGLHEFWGDLRLLFICRI